MIIKRKTLFKKSSNKPPTAQPSWIKSENNVGRQLALDTVQRSVNEPTV